MKHYPDFYTDTLHLIAGLLGLFLGASVWMGALASGQSPDVDPPWPHAAVSYSIDRAALVRIGEDANGREVLLIVPRVYGEDLTPHVDGSQTRFTPRQPFRAASEQLFLNGLCLDRGRHYKLQSDSEGRATGVELTKPPTFTSDGQPDRLKIDYDPL